MRRRTLVLFVWILCLSVFTGRADSASPFVAGFDRMGQHGELAPELSASLLLTELSCTACHSTANAQWKPKGGPDLSAAGSRLSKDWIKRFLTAPGDVQPGTTMPDLLHGLDASTRQSEVAALTAFLMSLQRPFPEIKATGLVPVPHEFWLKGDVENGRQLYHTVGCVACHEPDSEYATSPSQVSALDKLVEQLDADELRELGLTGAARPVNSVPHGDLPAKYNKLSLTHFLLDPLQVRPSGRMPHLKLQPFEAADLAAYLLREQSENVSTTELPPAADLIDRGRALFVDRGCVNCHAITGFHPLPTRTALHQLDWDSEQSCIRNPAGGQPRYVLDEQQQSALEQSNVSAALEQDFQLTLRLLQLNCFACHEREQLGGVGRKRQVYFETIGHVDIGDEGRLPPSLTHVGRKLTVGWLNKVFQGQGEIRPHMTIRMPMFAANQTADLPTWFARSDQADARDEQAVFGDTAGLAEHGRHLLDLGCVQCHPVRGESLPSVVGTDLDGVTGRVRPAWFRQFLLNPIDLKPRTRMPTFFPNGVATNQEILNGKVDQQIAAIWAYLKSNHQHPLPDKILQARSQSFELLPQEEPIVLRTFMNKAGTHAIAVGTPQKVHYAFDAEQCRFAEVWQGRFLDAHGTWFDRFTPPAEPLGTSLLDFPPGFHFAALSDENAPWPATRPPDDRPQFLGYSKDSGGIHFRYLYRDWLIVDTLQTNHKDLPDAAAGPGIVRQLSLTFTGSQPPDVRTSLWMRVNRQPVSDQPEVPNSQRPLIRVATMDDDGFTTDDRDASSQPVLDGHREWRIQLPTQRKIIQYVISYQWKND